jgi:hypothetical protein
VHHGLRLTGGSRGERDPHDVVGVAWPVRRGVGGVQVTTELVECDPGVPIERDLGIGGGDGDRVNQPRQPPRMLSIISVWSKLRNVSGTTMVCASENSVYSSISSGVRSVSSRVMAMTVPSKSAAP